MKKLAYTSLFALCGFFGFTSLNAQTLVDVHAGYDFGFDAAYLGGGVEINEWVLLTADLGTNADQVITKTNIAVRTMRFREAQVDVFLGLGGGRAWSVVENGYDDWMAELIATVQIRPFYFGYGLGFYTPIENPNLEGFGNYHYFRVGVLFDMR
ncbi:MAG: hypothetical protein HWD92_05705 [Flavobacteriia bacterium]|nr:hypothetical protein [Flavobacteriia bacterium]